MKSKIDNLPKGLKVFFVLHFLVDYIFAIPLMLFPVWTMSIFNFPAENLLFSRLVAAALLGIGGISLIAKNASIETYKTLLGLKNIWSISAILAISLTLFQSSNPEINPYLFSFLAIFIIFAIIWAYYQIKISKLIKHN